MFEYSRWSEPFMKQKETENQTVTRRKPRQERSQEKVALMFEAAMQLLEEGDLRSLSTNAVAAKAGISIGTLYQYFDGKDALLDALVARELGQMSTRILTPLEQEAQKKAAGATAEERTRAVVRAALSTYGGRSRVHRLLIQHAMNRPPGHHLTSMYARLIEMFQSPPESGAAPAARALNAAEAFVITYAMAGVLRSYSQAEEPPPQAALEDALVSLVLGFLARISAEA
ncbi:TetR/AcrR family transcriptional regulator [Stenotrophomonas sp.]|uniref:TetR/AcrR family transcriptional regulator n=1 Tax=Stenotrophomonas sp. TaxID=69392 RepID=UPI00289A386F|nr:TetR/AcrR family transcriptional regulator [Stenotrophomonas sp.]